MLLAVISLDPPVYFAASDLFCYTLLLRYFISPATVSAWPFIVVNLVQNFGQENYGKADCQRGDMGSSQNIYKI